MRLHTHTNRLLYVLSQFNAQLQLSMIFSTAHGGNVCRSFDYPEQEACNNGKSTPTCLIVYTNILFSIVMLIQRSWFELQH